MGKERLDRSALATLLVCAGVLAYTTFQWGGVVRTGRYESLLVLGLLAIFFTLRGSRDKWSLAPDRVVRWTTILLPIYVLLQLVPLPISVLRVLSPAHAEMVDALAPIGAKTDFASLSVFTAGTFQYLLLICGYLVIFFIIRELTCRFEERRWLATWPLIGIGAFEACLGLWQSLSANGHQVRWGTYANGNHYAGFLEMILPFAVVYPIAVLRRDRSRWNSPLRPAVSACGVWALAALMVAGVVYSFSRMGFIAVLFSLFVVGILVIGTRQLGSITRSRGRKSLAAGTLAGLVLGAFVVLPPTTLVQRFADLVSTDKLTADGRMQLWAETIPVISAYKFFGCGLNGYETAVAKYNLSGAVLTVDFAHNDYLQLLAELGFLGFLILAVLASSILRTAVRGTLESSEPEAAYFAVACTGALVAILLHSLADFNLYIPANAMLLAWIAGMTAGNRISTGAGQRPRTGLNIRNLSRANGS
jgi:O-antigen ligase